MAKKYKACYANIMTAAKKEQQQEIIAIWHKHILEDREVARNMLRDKHYTWSLFIFHLVIEKLFKILIMQNGETPPPIHRLSRLAELAKLDVPEQYNPWLAEITTFNIEARYRDEKLDLYRKATPEYTASWHKNCEEIFLWLEKQIK